MGKRMTAVYAMYKGDKFITEGTIAELMKETGLKESTLRNITMPAYFRRMEKHKHVGGDYKFLVRIEDTE